MGEILGDVLTWLLREVSGGGLVLGLLLGEEASEGDDVGIDALCANGTAVVVAVAVCAV